MPRFVVDAVFVSRTATPYNPFTDRRTGEVRPGGVTYSATVLLHDGDTLAVRLPDEAAYRMLEPMKIGQGIRVEVAPRQRDVVWNLTGVIPAVVPAGKSSAA